MIGEAAVAHDEADGVSSSPPRAARIHDENALAEALRAKKIAGAGLDVWEKEPPPHDHPLMAFDNVFVSPHTAGVTSDARRNMAKIAAEQMVATLAGDRPPRLINPEVWPPLRQTFCQGIRPRAGVASSRA